MNKSRYLYWQRSGGGQPILVLDCKCGVTTVDVGARRVYRCPGCKVTYEPPKEVVLR